jgi:hypothetical protein
MDSTQIILFILSIHASLFLPSHQQAVLPQQGTQQNIIQQTIYQFLKSNSLTTQVSNKKKIFIKFIGAMPLKISMKENMSKWQ